MVEYPTDAWTLTSLAMLTSYALVTAVVAFFPRGGT